MNKHRYKKLANQVMVITGASSGIGFATARRAAKAGARLVLSSRNEEVLAQVCEQIQQAGGRAVYVVGDIGDPATVRSIVQTAEDEFDGFDTWVNNAGVAIFSELKDLPNDEHERLFKTNYWGVVNGSRAAVDHFREQENGGTLINIASVNAEMPAPLLGAYAATKAAVKAYSEALRVELMHEQVPINVSLIMPAGVSSPLAEHSRSHTGERGKLTPPLYDTELVANAILTAAQRPVRNITVGGAGRLYTTAWGLMPPAMDRFVSWALPRTHAGGERVSGRDNLYEAGEDGQVYRNGQREGVRVSPYTRGRINLGKTFSLGVLIGTAVYLLNSEKRRNELKRQALLLRNNMTEHAGNRSLRYPLKDHSLPGRLRHPVKTIRQSLQ